MVGLFVFRLHHPLRYKQWLHVLVRLEAGSPSCEIAKLAMTQITKTLSDTQLRNEQKCEPRCAAQW